VVVNKQDDVTLGLGNALATRSQDAVPARGARRGRSFVTRILLVEDSPGDAELLRRMLSETVLRRFEIEVIPLLSEAIRRAPDGAFDLIVLDLTLPDSSGIETFEAMRWAAPMTPIVVLTGQDDARVGLAALNKGAQDYLVKGDIEGSRMVRALLFAIERDRFQGEKSDADLLRSAHQIAALGGFDWNIANARVTPSYGVPLLSNGESLTTDRRRFEESFRLLAESISEVFYITDADSQRILYINPAYETIWGQSCESLYADPSSFLGPLSEPDRIRLVAYLSRVGAGEESGVLEFEVHQSDAQARWVECRALPIRDASGAVYRINGFALDITERRRAQEALLASERRLLTLFESVHLLVVLLDRDGRVEYLNPFALHLTGYAHDEAFGRSWSDHFLPELNRSQVATAFRAMVDLDPPSSRLPILTKTGDVRTISWHTTVLRDDRGNSTGTLSVGEDVTERELLEHESHQARKLEAIGRLSAGVAHDFNNLLTVIISYAELLRNAFQPGDPSLEDLEPIVQAASAAAGLTRQLLAFSRQQVIQRREVPLNDLVIQSVRLLKRVIGEDIAIETMLSPHAPIVLIDPGQLEQVIMNLAVNARDAMPQGGTLAIETTIVDLDPADSGAGWLGAPGSFARVSMSDTGVGMTEQTRAKIFEPFFTTKELGKGTGLGLATVYGIIKQSGGFIWVSSAPGRGATFTIYLPLADRPTTPESDDAAVADPPCGTETILLVEDDPAVRIVARRILQRSGYTVLEAATSGAALEMADTHRGTIGLLLTDVVMPEMSGRQLVDAIMVFRPRMRALYMSGYTDDAVVRRGVLDSGVAYLQKPFTPDALARKVREMLDAELLTTPV
jgi:two-component system cell cycle sensor histidine kinase/response regulator CckA